MIYQIFTHHKFISTMYLCFYNILTMCSKLSINKVLIQCFYNILTMCSKLSVNKVLIQSLYNTSGTRDLRTPVVTPLQSPGTRSDPNRRCAGIRISCVYSQVINPGIYSLTRREKIQNPGSDILNLGSRKFWKFSKTRSSI
jgi:hypothetical protein